MFSLVRDCMIKKIMMVFLCMIFGGTSGFAAQAVQGNPFAPVTITEYVDFQCSYCAEAKNVVDQVIKNYHGQVNLVLKHLPLEFHAGALPAAKCFEALYRRNPAMAWKFFNLAFTEQSFLKGGDAGISYLIHKLGLNQQEMDQLTVDLTDPNLVAKIKNDMAEADARGVDEVPTFFIQGIKVNGYDRPDEFNQIIDAVLIGRNAGSVQ